MERNVLGKGLSALIPEGSGLKERIQNIQIDKVIASKFQPRKTFEDARLLELAESIKEKGVIQPILVRSKEDGFEIIAGERRFRAAKSLGLTEIPVIIKEVQDEDVLELSIIENIQREELTKIEEAKAYNRLSQEFGLTHETISKKVSKDRATITNLLRLLDLPEKIQNYLDKKSITMGHARCLLSIESEKEQIKLCEKIMRKGFSVRQTEVLTRNDLTGKKSSRKAKKDIYLNQVEEDLQHRFGTRVRIVRGKKRGRILIDFFSDEDLNRIISLINTSG